MWSLLYGMIARKLASKKMTIVVNLTVAKKDVKSSQSI